MSRTPSEASSLVMTSKSSSAPVSEVTVIDEPMVVLTSSRRPVAAFQ